MATTEVKIITLKQLGLYDGLVKKYVNDADAKSIKSVKIEGRTLKFYKVEEPIEEGTLPAYSIEIPETDLTTVTNAIDAVKAIADKLDGEDTVEGSVKAQIKALKTELEGQITASEYNDTEIKKSIKANTDAIGVLNGTGDGSVDKKVADAVASIVANAPASYDTLKEISDWISTHTEDASAMNSSIQTNKTDIANLKDDVAANKASLAEGGATATAIADAEKAGTDAQTSVNELAKRVDSIEDTSYVEATDEEINALFA